MRINYLGVAKERLNSWKVFIVLDDVDKLEQLEAVANELMWFGTGSRIIVTTENKYLFKRHDIKHIYEVSSPSGNEGHESRELFLEEKAFRGMDNLQFLRFYKQWWSDKATLHLHEDLDCLPLPRKLKLLHWESCPMKSLSFPLRSKCLIEIKMKESKLKKLWEGVPMLRSLKKMELSRSTSLEELPNLSEAVNLQHLDMRDCHKFPLVPYTVSELHLDSTGIREVPPWISDLYRLTQLTMSYCMKLRKISPRICELRMLQLLQFTGCINVKYFPAEIFHSFYLWHEFNLTLDYIDKNSSPTFTSEETHDFPLHLSLFGNGFEKLPGSLSELHADNCASLESLSPPYGSSHDPKLILKFINCWNLDQQARKLIIEKWACGYAVLPHSNVPDYFSHQARRSSRTVHLNRRKSYGSLRFKACVVLHRRDELDVVPYSNFQISCYVRGRRSITVYKWPEIYAHCQLCGNHMFILNSYFTLEEDNIPERKMRFEFKCLEKKNYPETVTPKILGCGVKLLKPCSSKYDSKAHPELSSLPLEDNEGNNNNVGKSSRRKKREWSSVAEGPERTSKNLRI
ncbi:PREDICTED: disease resistance protein RML1B-like [Camelina sativa]|uniref:Disease resistance protein RML1B-like n=1 Tax=Camelina sativa TaxID=90675 RepID=A0ABM0URM9_CAMSA|nr:PREDICTED: disease resistance protein RML1B-like [Camelina sativa]